MNQRHIQQIQERIGVTPDGRWGPLSQAALQKHLRALLPNPYRFPKNYREMFEFYGTPGTPCKGLTRIDTSKLQHLHFDGKRVRSVQCHEKVAQPLLNFLTELNDSEYFKILHQYGGCYNPRNVRGGTNISDHAWGAAIDLDANRNRLKWHWPMQAHMPIEVYEMAAKYGASSLGWTGNFDAMHITWRL